MRNMTRLVAALVMAGVFIFSGVYAASGTGASLVEQKKAAIVDVGNKICPVMGEEVSGRDFYEYNGKRYGLCCSMCPEAFAGDPEKYSAIANKEVAGK